MSMREQWSVAKVAEELWRKRNKKELRDSWKVKVTYSWVWEFPGQRKSRSRAGLRPGNLWQYWTTVER